MKSHVRNSVDVQLLVLDLEVQSPVEVTSPVGPKGAQSNDIHVRICVS
jgi:hypothetical protein